MTPALSLRIYEVAIRLMSASRSMILEPKFLDSALRAEGLDRSEAELSARSLLSTSVAQMTANEIEATFILAGDLNASNEGLQILNRMLLLKNHEMHENIAFWLQEAADPSSISSLSAAIGSDLDYLGWNDGKALTRKCFWALAAIGTADAWSVITRYSESQDPVVARWANEQMDRRES